MRTLWTKSRIIGLAISMSTILVFVTACGTDPAVQALEKNCPIIYKNLKSISKEPAIFEDSEFASKSFIVTNIGTETRKLAENEILIKFPYLDKLVVGRNRSQSNWDDVYRDAAAVYIIQQSLVGTTVKFPLSASELDGVIKRGKHDKEVEPLARKLFGDVAPEVQPGCGLVDTDNQTYIAWNQARDLLWKFGDYLQVIRDCSKSGYSFEQYNYPCAKKDYVPTPTNWTPTPVDPWTRTWGDPIMEGMAKFAWCWNKGLTYVARADACI